MKWDAESEPRVVHKGIGIFILRDASQNQETKLGTVICSFGSGVLHHYRTKIRLMKPDYSNHSSQNWRRYQYSKNVASRLVVGAVTSGVGPGRLGFESLPAVGLVAPPSAELGVAGGSPSGELTLEGYRHQGNLYKCEAATKLLKLHWHQQDSGRWCRQSDDLDGRTGTVPATLHHSPCTEKSTASTIKTERSWYFQPTWLGRSVVLLHLPQTWNRPYWWARRAIRIEVRSVSTVRNGRWILPVMPW